MLQRDKSFDIHQKKNKNSLSGFMNLETTAQELAVIIFFAQKNLSIEILIEEIWPLVLARDDFDCPGKLLMIAIFVIFCPFCYEHRAHKLKNCKAAFSQKDCL